MKIFFANLGLPDSFRNLKNSSFY